MDNDELDIFLEGLNIDRFEVALKSESDPAKRKQIERLLALEKAKRAARIRSLAIAARPFSP
jgi:hypothetical protein